MHSAPAVSHPVGRSLFAGALQGVVWLLGLATLAFWWYLTPPSWRQAVATALWIGVGVYAARAWLRAPTGELAWNGAQWTWRSQPVKLRSVLDLQGVLLLQASELSANPARHPQGWLWLERNGSSPRWAALRRALYSSGRSASAGQQHAPVP